MLARVAYIIFAGFRANLNTQDGPAYLDDLFKVATGVPVPPKRIQQFQADLVLDANGGFISPNKRTVLLLCYCKNPDGSTQLVEPWKDTHANAEQLRIIKAKEPFEMDELIRRGGLTREDGTASYERN